MATTKKYPKGSLPEIHHSPLKGEEKKNTQKNKKHQKKTKPQKTTNPKKKHKTNCRWNSTLGVKKAEKR